MSFTHSPHTHFNHLVWLTYYQDRKNKRIKSKERNKSWLPWRGKKFFFLSKWDWGHTRETWKENEVLETSKNIPKMEKKIYPTIGKERCTSCITERATGAPINLTKEQRWGLRRSSGKAGFDLQQETALKVQRDRSAIYWENYPWRLGKVCKIAK